MKTEKNNTVTIQDEINSLPEDQKSFVVEEIKRISTPNFEDCTIIGFNNCIPVTYPPIKDLILIGTEYQASSEDSGSLILAHKGKRFFT